jgi:hypothetical protein
MGNVTFGSGIYSTVCYGTATLTTISKATPSPMQAEHAVPGWSYMLKYAGASQGIILADSCKGYMHAYRYLDRSGFVMVLNLKGC